MFCTCGYFTVVCRQGGAVEHCMWQDNKIATTADVPSTLRIARLESLWLHLEWEQVCTRVEMEVVVWELVIGRS